MTKETTASTVAANVTTTAKKTKVKKPLSIPVGNKFEDQNVFVCVNGKVTIIPKGKVSEVPEEVYNEYIRAQAAKNYAYRVSENLQKQAAEEAKETGLGG